LGDEEFDRKGGDKESSITGGLEGERPQKYQEEIIGVHRLQTGEWEKGKRLAGG